MISLARFASKTSSRERTRHGGNPRYPVFILTPTEVGDTTTGSRLGREFWAPDFFFRRLGSGGGY